MACHFPFAVRTKFITETGYWTPVPCGKCPPCLKARANSWQVRLLEEQKISTSAYFVTATYDPAHCPVSPNGFKTLSKPDWQKFIKRLRYLHGSSAKKIRYYCAGEYGEKFSRPHYHAIIFDAQQDLIYKAWTLECDPIGDIRIDKCEGASISYTLKYIHKGRTVPRHPNDDRVPEFSLMSKGLGKSYLTPAMVAYHQADPDRFYATLPGGIKTPLPRYLKERIYTEDQRTAYAKRLAKKFGYIEAEKFLKSGLTQFEYDRAKHEAKKADILNFKNKSKR